MAANSNIHFFFKDTTIRLTERIRLKAFINGIFKKEQQKLKTLNYIFCRDKELLRMNRNYLDHDFYTDIITFDLSGDNKEIEGEVYISIDRIRENALSFKTTLREELLRVIFHGALHLCGYKDKTKSEKSLMRRKEDSYLLSYL